MSELIKNVGQNISIYRKELLIDTCKFDNELLSGG